jgi:hypothetical protein
MYSHSKATKHLEDGTYPNLTAKKLLKYCRILNIQVLASSSKTTLVETVRKYRAGKEEAIAWQKKEEEKKKKKMERQNIAADFESAILQCARNGNIALLKEQMKSPPSYFYYDNIFG